MKWPYENIHYDEINDAIRVCEEIIVSLGGKFITQRRLNETWFLSDEFSIEEEITKNVYRFEESYVSVDKMYFTDKPCLVLEFADEIEGAYEDADPFPFDLPLEEMKLEVKYALDLLPYPS